MELAAAVASHKPSAPEAAPPTSPTAAGEAPTRPPQPGPLRQLLLDALVTADAMGTFVDILKENGQKRTLAKSLTEAPPSSDSAKV
jgi:hypothetical protein